MFFFTFLFLIISVFSNYLINTTAQSPESYSFVLSTCGTDTFITVEISDNKCEFANKIYNPQALSCKLDNNNQWKITLAGCSTHCIYSWSFNVTDVSQQKIDAKYECSGESSDHHKDTDVEYLAKPPSTYFLYLHLNDEWLPTNIIVAPNRCFATIPLKISNSECHCDVSSCIVSVYSDYYTLPFNMKLDDEDPGIPDHLVDAYIDVPLSYSTQAPKIYNFRHERTCDTFFATIIVDDKICSTITTSGILGVCECQNGQCTVNISGCDNGCKNTWTFDLNNTIDTDITYTCEDGHHGIDNDPHVHYLNFSKDNSVFYPSEMVALCFLGVNIETGQMMVPITNISACIDSYYLDKDITYSPFSEHIFIGDNNLAYDCQNLSSAVNELCESFLHYISNVNNVYRGYSDAIATIGSAFVGMINDLTVNPASQAFDNKIKHGNILEIVSDVLGLPGGSGSGVANNVFKQGTYIGVFPVIDLGMNLIKNLIGDNENPPSDLVSPISYNELANAFTSTETRYKGLMSDSLKSLDSMVMAYKYGLTNSLNKFISFDTNENDLSAISEGFKPLLTAKVVSLILKINGVKICSNNSGGFNAEGYCGIYNDACGVAQYGRCGTMITKFGQYVLGNATRNSNNDLYIDPSNFACLMANHNFRCDQFQRMNYGNINIVDACTQSNGWDLPIDQDCILGDFTCSGRGDFDLCWDIVSGVNPPRHIRNERSVNPKKKKNG